MPKCFLEIDAETSSKSLVSWKFQRCNPSGGVNSIAFSFWRVWTFFKVDFSPKVVNLGRRDKYSAWTGLVGLGWNVNSCMWPHLCFSLGQVRSDEEEADWTDATVMAAATPVIERHWRSAKLRQDSSEADAASVRSKTAHPSLASRYSADMQEDPQSALESSGKTLQQLRFAFCSFSSIAFPMATGTGHNKVADWLLPPLLLVESRGHNSAQWMTGSPAANVGPHRFQLNFSLVAGSRKSEF